MRIFHLPRLSGPVVSLKVSKCSGGGRLSRLVGALALLGGIASCGGGDGGATLTASAHNVDAAVNAALAGGIPASNLSIGIPFYGRGWVGVEPGPNGDGLYQSATSAARSNWDNSSTGPTGANDYKDILTFSGVEYYNPVAQSAWKYDANSKVFWSYDNLQTVGLKGAYARNKGLGEMFAWSIDGDSNNQLLSQMRNSLPNGTIAAYYPQWAIYGRGFLPKDMGDAINKGKIDRINYAFANIYEKNGGYECDGTVNQKEYSTNNLMPDPKVNPTGYQTWLNNSGKGGDRWAEVSKGFTAAESVDGVADAATDKLAGIWGQFKKIKQKYTDTPPKIYVSLGGWTYSKFFSKAASSDALRKQLVTSCINLYIKGNVPTVTGDSRGGDGVGVDVFDGIDIDWEAPGVNTTQPYNTYDSTNDRQNYVLLLQEFRNQLNAYSLTRSDNKSYGLSIAVLTGSDNYKYIDFQSITKLAKPVQLMTYDYHGSWDLSKTGFNAPIYNDPKGPNQGK